MPQDVKKTFKQKRKSFATDFVKQKELLDPEKRCQDDFEAFMKGLRIDLS